MDNSIRVFYTIRIELLADYNPQCAAPTKNALVIIGTLKTNPI